MMSPVWITACRGNLPVNTWKSRPTLRRGCPAVLHLLRMRQYIIRSDPNWRPRGTPRTSILELQTLRAKYPQLEGIFFDEEVHNGSKKYILELTRAIRENGLDDLKYDVMCGQWPMDEEVLDAMKSAGYYMIRLGIETAGEHAARKAWS